MNGQAERQFNTKDALREVVRGYLEQDHPDALEDFDLVFDDVYATLQRKAQHPETAPTGKECEGIAFDASMLTGTVITIACVVGTEMLKAAAIDSIQRDLIPRLDAAEKKLAKWTGQPVLVHRIRERVEGILKHLG